MKIFLGIVIIAFVFEAIAKMKVGNKINSVFGKISYEIYLLHPGVYMLLVSIFPDTNSGKFIILAIVITLVLSYFLYLLCRKLATLAKYY